MARNSEKQLSSLNRWLLEKERKEKEKKHPPRPNLSALSSASEIRQWLPNLKSELEYCLTQMGGVRNYTDKKTREFEEKVEALQQEYQRYLRKLRYFESQEGVSTTHGNVRPYVSKKRRLELQGNQSGQEKLPEISIPKKIATPLLDEEVKETVPLQPSKQSK
ncbi:uncharacterized protein LOC134186183 [Corticium candelabrum]|uniref:uncharacterized protein LOC134186183 n=1 Tax=Corticium candelabrum TaxID=121492 RepID=UPI002E26A358|nr:uncharacterized protein LOC134186183 [Corticium candelabrum]